MEGALTKAGLRSAAMINREHELPIKRQAQLLGMAIRGAEALKAFREHHPAAFRN